MWLSQGDMTHQTNFYIAAANYYEPGPQSTRGCTETIHLPNQEHEQYRPQVSMAIKGPCLEGSARNGITKA